MKKVLLFSFEYPPMCGGAGRVAQRLASLLCQSEFDIDVLTTSNVSQNKNIKIYKAKYIPFIFPYLLWRKLNEINYKKYDTIIVNDVGAALVASFFFDIDTMRKSLVIIHGGENEKILEKPKTIFKLVNFKSKYKKLLTNSKAIICVSNYMVKVMKEKLSDIDENKFIKINTGIDRTVFYNEKIDLREKYNLNKEDIIIFSASRIIKEKGYDDLYNILKKIVTVDNKQYVWFIAGEGEYKEILIEKAKKDNLIKNIFFLGNIEQDELRKIYSSCDIFILLSHFNEAYGLVYLESILCGTPAIGYNRGGVNEVIKNNINGFLVDNIEECYKLLFNKTYLKLDKLKLQETIDNSNEDIKKIITLCK